MAFPLRFTIDRTEDATPNFSSRCASSSSRSPVPFERASVAREGLLPHDRKTRYRAPTMVNDVFGLAGTTIDRRYRVDAAIGEGGFGVVYRGFHLAFRHAVAVKCLKLPPHFTPEAQALFVERFREEGAFLSKLSEHGSIVRVFDLDVTATPRVAAVPYMVLEWLEGQELERQLEDRRARGQAPHTQAEATALLRPAIDAVALAHTHKIAHRDLKPANLYTANTSKGTVLKVLDFGIAKAMQEGETATQVATRTSSGFSAFSPQYGAPEQFRAKRYGATGPWTDVHALGLMLSELVSGKRPIEGEEVADYYEAGTSERRPTPRARGADVSDAFEAICAKALALDPRTRYQNAGELGLALDALVEARDDEAAPPPAVNTQLAEPLALDAVVNTVLAEPLEPEAPKTHLAEPLSPESARGKTVLAEPRVPSRSAPEPRSRTWLLPLGIGALAVVAGIAAVIATSGPPAGSSPGSTATSASAPHPSASAVTSANVGPETTIAKGKRLFFDGSVRENASSAISLFRQECDGGKQDGCAGLAWAQQIGRGVPKDRAQAFRAADAACTQGSLFGCVVLGRSYALGSGVAKDAKRAVELFQKACDGDDLFGCSNLGMAYSSGDGVAESRKRAHRAAAQGVRWRRDGGLPRARVRAARAAQPRRHAAVLRAGLRRRRARRLRSVRERAARRPGARREGGFPARCQCTQGRSVPEGL